MRRSPSARSLPTAPSAPSLYGRSPLTPQRCLVVVLSTGALHIGNAPATATVSACKALTAGIILFLLSCDWLQLTVCELVPSHTAPPAHLGKPSSISNSFFSGRPPPQAFPADVLGCYRPETNLCVCNSPPFQSLFVWLCGQCIFNSLGLPRHRLHRPPRPYRLLFFGM